MPKDTNEHLDEVRRNVAQAIDSSVGLCVEARAIVYLAEVIRAAMVTPRA